MGLTPSDLLTVTLVVTFAVALGGAAYSRLLGWHRSRSPRLRLLTGTRSQHAAIVLAVRPVVRELIPGLEAAGLEIGSIALLPTLAGPQGPSRAGQRPVMIGETGGGQLFQAHGHSRGPV